MMDFAENVVTAELTGAEPERSLHLLCQAGVPLKKIEHIKELTIRFQCSRKDVKLARVLAKKQGDDLKILKEAGLILMWRKIIGRPILIAGALMLLGFTLFLPTRIFFFRIEGNQSIPSHEIISAVQECGIRFGISRRHIRSEKIKNALLEMIPELKWAGINTVGCTAVISVRERNMQTSNKATTGVSSIIAARDGFVTSCTITKGSALCVPGQVVRTGQTLISGYTDCGICIQATHAEGEVYAQTRWNIQMIIPKQKMIRTDQMGQSRHYSLVIGKKRINLWKDSGIWDATCGRMYKEYYLTLPGGYVLPFCLGVETTTDWKITPYDADIEMHLSMLKDFSRELVLNQMISGQILDEQFQILSENGRYIAKGTYLCSEMIGRTIMEEIGDTNGKTN